MPRNTDSKLISSISTNTGAPSMYVAHTLEALGDALCAVLREQDEVVVQGLGRFRRDDVGSLSNRVVFLPQQNLTLARPTSVAEGNP